MCEEAIKTMRSLLNIQGQSGNWDYNDYMHGMYNGMELMLSVAEKREPIFKEKVDV
jgi:hypothetical protein